MIRERPARLSVVALLEAAGLPATDLTDAHFEHFLVTGTDGVPSPLEFSPHDQTTLADEL
jgi:hypothetical protein